MTVVAIASCGTPETAQPATTSSTIVGVPTTTQIATAQPERSTIPTFDSALPGLVEKAVSDLAWRLGVDESQIDVEIAEEVTWSDGAIGCPQPGFGYTQALVHGARVVLEHDGEKHIYHQGGEDKPFWCATPGDPVGD